MIKQVQKDYTTNDAINGLGENTETDSDTHNNPSDEDLNNSQTYNFNRFALLLENDEAMTF